MNSIFVLYKDLAVKGSKNEGEMQLKKDILQHLSDLYNLGGFFVVTAQHL